MQLCSFAFVCSFVFTLFPLPVVLNTGAADLASVPSCFLSLSWSRCFSHTYTNIPHLTPLFVSLFLPPRGEWSLCISVGSAGSMFRAPEMPSWLCLLSDPSMLADLALTTPNASASQPEAVESLPFLLTTHGHHLTQNRAALSKSYANADFATSLTLPHIWTPVLRTTQAVKTI